jgi:NADH-quinone oxidoreductase subunit E
MQNHPDIQCVKVIKTNLKISIMFEVKEIIQEKIGQYGRERKALLPILQGIIQKNNSIRKTDMVEIAEALDISSADVYGTASFYSFLEPGEKGKYIIRLCKSTICEMHGKNEILMTLQERLGIELGQTSHDKLFTLLGTNCIGMCDMAPSMLINDKPYSNLTVELINEIIGELRNKK